MEPQSVFACGTLVAVMILPALFASIGANSAIRCEWHREDIYSRCIRPYIVKVITPPAALGWTCALLVFFILFFRRSIPTIITQIGLNEWLGLFVAAFAGMLTSFIWARRRGIRIYSANVRRAGY